MRGWCSRPRGSGLVHSPKPDRPEWTRRAFLLGPVSFSQRLLEKSLCSSQPSPWPGNYWHCGRSLPTPRGVSGKDAHRMLSGSALCNPPQRTVPAAQPQRVPAASAALPPPAPAPHLQAAQAALQDRGHSLGQDTLPVATVSGPLTAACPGTLSLCSPSSLEDRPLHPWTAPRGTRHRPLHPRAPAPSRFRSCRNATVLPSRNSESGWGLPP